MGTSVNQASPKTPPWRLARAALARPEFEVERQSQELWRAALGERGERLQADLSHPAIAGACRIAATGASPVDALNAWDREVVTARAAGLTFDIARRALARAAAANGGVTGFAAELFAEMTSYYASRDLPSIVGAKFRLSAPVQAIRLKEDLRAVARQASRVRPADPTPAKWQAYVNAVLAALTEGAPR